MQYKTPWRKIECECCGVVFKTKGHNAKYCPECREFLAQKKKPEALEDTRKIELPILPINAVKEISVKHDMSYGDTVAWLKTHYPDGRVKRC